MIAGIHDSNVCRYFKRKATMSSFREKMELSFLERKPSSCRMRAREEVGKHLKKPKKIHYDEHFNKDWDKDLWD